MATDKRRKNFKKRYIIIPAVIVVALVGLSMIVLKCLETALFEQEEAKTGSIATHSSFSGNVAPHEQEIPHR